MLEQRVALACEVSVIVARNERQESATWPVAENVHRDGILDVSIVPARVSADLTARARDIATRIASALDYRGVLCVEMFVGSDGALLVNEIAPRPHNSGHYTIDACVTSQFEQQARVLADLPLGDTAQHTPAVMVNLLGDLWFDGPAAQAPREPAVARRAGRTAGEASSLWQGGAPARAQDGPRDLPWRDTRRRRGGRAGGEANALDSRRRRSLSA